MCKKVLILYPQDTYISAAKSVGLIPVFNHDEDADCLILTGGGDVSPCIYGRAFSKAENVDLKRDQTELYFLEKYFKKGKPILGVCRGLQLANVFFGGTISERVYLHDQILGTDRRHLVITKNGTFLNEIYGEKLLVNSAHRQAVDNVAKPLTVSGEALDGVIECLTYKNVILTQFHPERMGKVGLKIFEAFKNLS